MKILSDCHVHTSFSGDSPAAMQDQIESAIRAGLRILTFTDHLDLDYPYDRCPDLKDGAFDLDIPAAYSSFSALKEMYAGRIELHFGIEMGLLPYLGPTYEEILAEHPEIEFVIGSTHLSSMPADGGEIYADPYYLSFFENMTVEEALRRYFRFSLECVERCGFFDSYGHLDYIVRYTPDKGLTYKYEDYADVIDPILRLLAERGTALELNTSSLRKGCMEPNPCRKILRRFKELGGKMITVGSDAHRTNEIAADFGEAERALRDCGYDSYYVFRNRVPVEMRL
ncbi:MAG: histidinol-phosphatase HisJ family protein [Lachnospiraceae bacterium]|nr:histidinol-phosphatase HisJ family protein [Lachnospiraceae bacterium]